MEGNHPFSNVFFLSRRGVGIGRDAIPNTMLLALHPHVNVCECHEEES
jgi:hypothetical protein